MEFTIHGKHNARVYATLLVCMYVVHLYDCFIFFYHYTFFFPFSNHMFDLHNCFSLIPLSSDKLPASCHLEGHTLQCIQGPIVVLETNHIVEKYLASARSPSSIIWT